MRRGAKLVFLAVNLLCFAVLLAAQQGNFPAGGSPGGTNGQLQFNNNGAFAGSTQITVSNSGTALAITGVNSQPNAVTIASAGSGQQNTLVLTGAASNGQPILTITANGETGPGLQSYSYATATNCSSSASPAVCGSAASGSVTLAAAATTEVVNTTAVTANSQILLTRDDSLGTKLSVTCNTATVVGTIRVSARTGGTSFTIAVDTTPATNPLCLSYTIVN